MPLQQGRPGRQRVSISGCRDVRFHLPETFADFGQGYARRRQVGAVRVRRRVAAGALRKFEIAEQQGH